LNLNFKIIIMKKIIIAAVLILIALAIAGIIYYQTQPIKTRPAAENNPMGAASQNQTATTTIRQTENSATGTVQIKTEGSGKAEIVVSEPTMQTNSSVETCKAATGESINLFEAQKIFDASQCSREGSAKPEHFCNETTGTLWIDIMAYRKGCNPACVINVKTKTAEVNWRCTGAIEP
jgi:hypothetical protein